MPAVKKNESVIPDVYKFPTTPGACVDRLYQLDLARATAQAKVDALKNEYNALEKYLIDTLPKADLEGAIGRRATAKLVKMTVPKIDDWEKLRAYIKRTGEWDLIQKRLSNTAFRDRWADKKVIPGVGQFNVIKLSVHAR